MNPIPPGWPAKLPLLVLAPGDRVALAEAATRSGAVGLVDADATSPGVLANVSGPFAALVGGERTLPPAARVVVLKRDAAPDAGKVHAREGRIVLAEAPGPGVHALVARGATGEETVSRVRAAAASGLPVFAWGGLDSPARASARAAGATGLILAESLWLLPEAGLDAEAKDALARASARDFDAGPAVLPGGIAVGRDALLAKFTLRRHGSLEAALAAALAEETGRPSRASGPPTPPVASAGAKFETRPREDAIAIIGMGCVLPQASGVAEFWQNVVGKKDCIIEVPRDRWDPAIFHDPDPRAPDKTYAKIGGFITAFAFDPLRFRIPPTVAKSLDPVQQMTLAAVAEALADAGLDRKAFDRSRAAVILGNSMGGELRDEYARRVYAAEFAAAMSDVVPAARLEERLGAYRDRFRPITEDAMPGELANVIAGRVANVFDLGGTNCTTDAACASSLAALDLAVKGLLTREHDVVVTGGADRSMDVATYVKFCKIGALSPDGSRPFDERANGFVMGEGVGILVLKRLADAVRDGDRIHAVLRGVGASSDGRGKGITAPNPQGQRRAVERALRDARLEARHVQLVEAHGTGTPVGDVVEVETLAKVYAGLAPRSVALGSVKSQIGHLKSAAGAASLLKVVSALRERTLPPSLRFERPNPRIGWEATPFFVNTEARPWPAPPGGEPRRAAVSAFGFGGTNYHVIVEEHVPAYHGGRAGTEASAPVAAAAPAPAAAPSWPFTGGVVAVGGSSPGEVAERLRGLAAEATRDPAGTLARRHGRFPLSERCRVVLAVGDSSRLAEQARAAAEQVADPKARAGLALRGAFYGEGAPAGKVALLFPGQGSQYANMLRALRDAFPVVRGTFDEADEVMAPLLGRKLTDLLFVDPADPAAVERAEAALRETEVTQPAVLAADVALHRLLESWGLRADVVAGHSLGEYAALVAAGVLTFRDALAAVSARGKEMASVRVPDKGRMASVAASPAEVSALLEGIPGYVVAANLNSPTQTVLAGESAAVEAAIARCGERNLAVVPLNVSAAFHSRIVAPAVEPLARVLSRLEVEAPRVPVSANATGAYYPPRREEILALLSRQVASPVLWQSQIERLHGDGARVFVEVGPKRVLAGLAEECLRGKEPSLVVSTNHPKKGDAASLFEAAARLLAAGIPLQLPFVASGASHPQPRPAEPATRVALPPAPEPSPARAPARAVEPPARSRPLPSLASAREKIEAALAEATAAAEARAQAAETELARHRSLGLVPAEVVVTGAAVGLPGRARRVFDDGNVAALLRGENRIDALTPAERAKFLDKGIVRVVKGDGDPVFERVESDAQAIHLAGVRGDLDLVSDYGLKAEFAASLDPVTGLAVAAGLDALRDARIPLVRDAAPAKGRAIDGSWALPEELRDSTGIVFASAFPGLDNLVADLSRAFARRFGAAAREELADLYASFVREVRDPEARERLTRWFTSNVARLQEPGAGPDVVEEFHRGFLFRILALGHAQLAEVVRARGPALHVNAACASTTAALAVAEDWIRAGRARRVLVVGADDATSPRLLEWIGSGFLAAGAATTAVTVEEGALPFDRRRHGMIVGMGAVGLVLESADAAAERGVAPVATLVATRIVNSAHHGSRLDEAHVGAAVDGFVETVATRERLDRATLARSSLFVSHETYTPARGGSASAEVAALRRAFPDAATEIAIVNVKGYTGHPMGAGLEDALAVKALQHDAAPPIPNLREPDPALGPLRFHGGGPHGRRYAIRLAAGFGSQLALACFRQAARGDSRISDAARHQAWLDRIGGHAGAATEVVHRTLRIVPGAVAPSPAIVPAPQAPSIPASAAEPLAPGHVQDRIVRLVAQRTGYPVEALALDLDLEADLGIDTVKQAELFGEIRSTFGLEREEGVRLRDHPTLGRVAEYVTSRLAKAGNPPPGPAAAPAAPAAPSSPSPGADDPLPEIRRILAARTGYPEDALAADLDLEADLGIDTVKQAEVFAAVRERFGIARVEGLRLRDYPKLADVARFVTLHRGPAPAVTSPREDAPRAAPAATAVAPAQPPAPPAVRAEAVRFLAPRAMLAPLPSERRSVSGRCLLLTDDGGVASHVAHRLREQGARVAFLGERAPEGFPRFEARGRDAAAISQAMERARTDLGRIDGFVHLAPIADTAAWGERDPASLRESLEREAGLLHHAARALEADALAGGGVLVAATALGGAWGTDAAPSANPVGGAIAGLLKALAREYPSALVRAIDTDPHEPAADRAARIVEEISAPGGPGEVGWRRGERVELASLPAEVPDAPPPLERGDFVVVTGGGAGIAAECAKALSRAVPGLRFLLLGRTPLPADAAAIAARDDAAWQAARDRVSAGIVARGERATPVAVERALAPERRAAGIARALADLRADGAEAEYAAADVADAAAVADALATARTRFGPIRALVHAAGVEESRRFAEKDPAAFERVVAPKALGAIHLLDAARPDALKAVVFFGSIAGRFGNAGQAEYAAANDFLAKLALTLRARGVPATCISWTAWGDVGMATRGSTLQVLRAAGIEPLATGDGARAFLRALRCDEAELVVAKGLGAFETSASFAAEVSMELRPEDPMLADHRVGGTPILPGVAGLDLLARAALQRAPGMRVLGFRDVRFSAPVRVREPVRVAGRTRAARAVGGDRIHVEAVLHAGDAQPFRATVVLGPVGHVPPAASPPRPAAPADADADAIYARFFHGPAFRVLHAVRALGPRVVEATGAAPAPSTLLSPARGNAPLALEALLQTAGLWGLAVRAVEALPVAIDSVEFFEAPASPAGLTLRAAALAEGELGFRYDAQALSASGEVVARVRGLTLATTGTLAGDREFRLAPFPLEWVEAGGRRIARVPVGWTGLDEAGLLLDAAERGTVTGLTGPGAAKRSAEFLAGRLAAKAALRDAGRAGPWHVLAVPRGDDGAPKAPVSITHSGEWAAAVAFDPDRERVGIDLERIEARADAFLEEAFTAAERRRLGTPASARDATRSWAAKEAVTKVLGKGLSIDLHSIDVTLAGDRADADLSGAAKDAFLDLGLRTLEVTVAQRVPGHALAVAVARRK